MLLYALKMLQAQGETYLLETTMYSLHTYTFWRTVHDLALLTLQMYYNEKVVGLNDFATPYTVVGNTKRQIALGEKNNKGNR